MANATAREILRQKAKDAGALADLLLQRQTLVDASALYRIASALMVAANSGASEYTYDGVLVFESLPKPKKARPTCIRTVQGQLSISIRGHVRNQTNDGSLDEPTSELSVGIELDGLGSGLERRYHCAWHIDRHESGGEEPHDVHPRYHIQFGGRRLLEKFADEDFGGIFVFGAPRIATPPMDVVLAVDFFLANFRGEAWHELREEPSYLEIMSRAQAEYWVPYVASLSSAWNPSGRASGWLVHDIWPALSRGGGGRG